MPKKWDQRQIKQLRRQLGLSQPRFAELVGVSLRLVCYWEAGEREPTLLHRNALNGVDAEAKGVDNA